MEKFFNDPNSCSVPVYFEQVETPIYCSRYALIKNTEYFYSYFNTDLKQGCRDDNHPTLPKEFHSISEKVFNFFHGRPTTALLLEQLKHPRKPQFLTNILILEEEISLLIAFCKFLGADINQFPEYAAWKDCPIQDFEDFQERLEHFKFNHSLFVYFQLNFEMICSKNDKDVFKDERYLLLIKKFVTVVVKKNNCWEKKELLYNVR